MSHSGYDITFSSHISLIILFLDYYLFSYYLIIMFAEATSNLTRPKSHWLYQHFSIPTTWNLCQFLYSFDLYFLAGLNFMVNNNNDILMPSIFLPPLPFVNQTTTPILLTKAPPQLCFLPSPSTDTDFCQNWSL